MKQAQENEETNLIPLRSNDGGIYASGLIPLTRDYSLQEILSYILHPHHEINANPLRNASLKAKRLNFYLTPEPHNPPPNNIPPSRIINATFQILSRYSKTPNTIPTVMNNLIHEGVN